MRLYRIGDLNTGKAVEIPATTARVALFKYHKGTPMKMKKGEEIVFDIVVRDMGVHFEVVMVEYTTGSHKVSERDGRLVGFGTIPPDARILDWKWLPKGQSIPEGWTTRVKVRDRVARERSIFESDMKDLWDSLLRANELKRNRAS